VDAPQRDIEIVASLDSLEQDIAALRLRWWHLLLWVRSPLRSLERRFGDCEKVAQAGIEGARKSRESNWRVLADSPSASSLAPNYLTLAHLELLDRETALTSRLERTRFLLLSKQSEQHARRSVALGVVGVVFGVFGLVLGLLSFAVSYKPLSDWSWLRWIQDSTMGTSRQ
jgi:hypothetical protein